MNPDDTWRPANCLEGFQCPGCGQREKFHITVSSWAIVTDDGIDELSDSDWEDESFCQCPFCLHDGVVSEFKDTALLHHVIEELA